MTITNPTTLEKRAKGLLESPTEDAILKALQDVTHEAFESGEQARDHLKRRLFEGTLLLTAARGATDNGETCFSCGEAFAHLETCELVAHLELVLKERDDAQRTPPTSSVVTTEPVGAAVGPTDPPEPGGGEADAGERPV